MPSTGSTVHVTEHAAVLRSGSWGGAGEGQAMVLEMVIAEPVPQASPPSQAAVVVVRILLQVQELSQAAVQVQSDSAQTASVATAFGQRKPPSTPWLWEPAMFGTK
jgi:hypothetical protein